MRILNVALFTLPGIAVAQADTSVKITFGGFVDSYYAWDFDRPPTFDRSFSGGALFTTQPARHNEFNVNLVFIDVKLDGARIHGRIALQAGTSVQSNYSAEPTNGAVSGPTLARHLQEAFAGAKVAPTLWIDGGVFYSHMGMEGWVSRDNLTYTRSLVADYSPYYSTGVRAVWQPTAKLSAQLHIVNGWQNISENNTGKGVGLRVDYAPSASSVLSYYNFFTDEAGNRLRTFNGIGGKATRGRATLLGELDVGTQSESDPSGGTASWWGCTAVARWSVTSSAALVARVERYDDESQVIIATGVSNGAFRADGGSLGIEIVPQPRFLWRTELRGFQNGSAVFPNGSSAAPRKSDAFVVSSLSLTF